MAISRVVRSISRSPRQTGASRGRAGGRRREDDGPGTAVAAREHVDAREQLLERVRLDEVVVGAAVEAGDPVAHRVAGGEHEDRRPDLGLAQAPARLDAIDAREHHVEHHDAVDVGVHAPQRLLARRHDVDGDVLACQAAPQGVGHPPVVLDQQHAHEPVKRATHRKPPRHRRSCGAAVTSGATEPPMTIALIPRRPDPPPNPAPDGHLPVIFGGDPDGKAQGQCRARSIPPSSARDHVRRGHDATRTEPGARRTRGATERTHVISAGHRHRARPGRDRAVPGLEPRALGARARVDRRKLGDARHPVLAGGQRDRRSTWPTSSPCTAPPRWRCCGSSAPTGCASSAGSSAALARSIRERTLQRSATPTSGWPG